MENSLDDASTTQWDAAWKAANTTGSGCWSATTDDLINHPPHYNVGEIETIDYIVDVLGKDKAAAYCHGNVLKYTGSRLWAKANPLQDAKKAVWYLNKMIDLMEHTHDE